MEHSMRAPNHRCRGAEGSLQGACRYSSGHSIPIEYGGLCLLWGLASMKQLMPETAHIFLVTLLCVFPARV